MNIQFRTQDFYIKEVNTKQGEVEVVQLKGGLAFDKDFIEEMKEKGVKKFADNEEEENDDEE